MWGHPDESTEESSGEDTEMDDDELRVEHILLEMEELAQNRLTPLREEVDEYIFSGDEDQEGGWAEEDF